MISHYLLIISYFLSTGRATPSAALQLLDQELISRFSDRVEKKLVL